MQVKQGSIKSKGNRDRLLKFGVIAALIIAIVVAITIGASNASATPGNTSACQSCHTYQGGNLRVTTDTTTKTVAPGESFAVSTSWTGGGGSRTEINWPTVSNNTQFNPTPRVPYSAGNTSGTTSSTLTAPTTLGTYTVRVYATQMTPTMETDYKDMTITVAAATYTITASAGANGSITPSGAVTVNSGASRAFTIAASTGYQVADVLVDGASVGAVSSYNFTNVTANHTISASFAVTAVSSPGDDDDDDEDDSDNDADDDSDDEDDDSDDSNHKRHKSHRNHGDWGDRDEDRESERD